MKDMECIQQLYGSERFTNWSNQGMLGPTLSCSLNDSFNVEGINGNGKLKYPIGLITADEVNMAGGITWLRQYTLLFVQWRNLCGQCRHMNLAIGFQTICFI